MFRYFTMFIFMTLLGYLYEKYRLKNDENEELAKYDAVKRFLLNEDDLLSSKPIMWIFNDYEVNARSWPSFFSRNTTHLNQPYIELCVQSIIKNCGDTFNICLIDDESFSKLIPEWNIDFTRLANPVKKHMRMLAMSRLLYYYGGLKIPSSTIVLKNLMPTFKENLINGDAFVFEAVNRGSTSTYTSFFPTCNFIGCRKRAPIIKKLIDYLEKLNTDDYTNEMDFLGQVDRWLFEQCQNKKMSLAGGEVIGTKTCKDKPVYIDCLLGTSYISFDTDEMRALYIPGDEILKRTKYQWFARLSKEQVLKSDTIIGKYLLISQGSK